ncbi:MAG: VWA domain-containing protein [Candidatus Aenigmarchaeota archaeon]|nr:VWA domain-containing protein [Candidatus Aenigmarchaeota archaeon]
MKLIFTYEYLNLLLILVGLVIILFLLSKKFTKKRTMIFGNYETLEKSMGKKIFSVSIVPLILRIIVFVLIIITISDPRLVYGQYIANTDFVMAIDTSSSMLTPDFTPNRLEAAKEVYLEWLDSIEKTKIGIVTFAGQAYVKTSITEDSNELKKIMRSIKLEQPAGTAIGDALITSTSLLYSSERNRTIILTTDGISNMGTNINESLKTLKENNIRVIVIGIGTKQENVTVYDNTTDTNTTYSKFPDLDEESLRMIANETNGMYFVVSNKTSLSEAMKTGIKYKEAVISPTFYLLLLVCFVLLIEWGLEITKYKPLP